MARHPLQPAMTKKGPSHARIRAGGPRFHARARRAHCDDHARLDLALPVAQKASLIAPRKGYDYAPSMSTLPRDVRRRPAHRRSDVSTVPAHCPTGERAYRGLDTGSGASLAPCRRVRVAGATPPAGRLPDSGPSVGHSAVPDYPAELISGCAFTTRAASSSARIELDNFPFPCVIRTSVYCITGWR